MKKKDYNETMCSAVDVLSDDIRKSMKDNSAYISMYLDSDGYYTCNMYGTKMDIVNLIGFAMLDEKVNPLFAEAIRLALISKNIKNKVK